jgi:hypothetical protein
MGVVTRQNITRVAHGIVILTVEGEQLRKMITKFIPGLKVALFDDSVKSFKTRDNCLYQVTFHE